MASSFEQEPITARRTVSPQLLRESRNRASARPTTPVPPDAWPAAEEPQLEIVEEHEVQIERDSSGGFRVCEINASRTSDPRSE